jgi:hypothetical protein
MKEMKWKWMEWSQAHRDLRTKNYSTYYFFFFLFVMTSFCLVFIDVIVLLCKEHECRSCGSVEDCELSEDAGVNESVSELRGFCFTEGL